MLIGWQRCSPRPFDYLKFDFLRVTGILYSCSIFRTACTLADAALFRCMHFTIILSCDALYDIYVHPHVLFISMTFLKHSFMLLFRLWIRT